MPTLALTNFNITVSVLGGFISLFGLVSYLLKENFYMSEARKLLPGIPAHGPLVSFLPGFNFPSIALTEAHRWHSLITSGRSHLLASRHEFDPAHGVRVGQPG
jgi:hypothetical protein